MMHPISHLRAEQCWEYGVKSILSFQVCCCLETSYQRPLIQVIASKLLVLPSRGQSQWKGLLALTFLHWPELVTWPPVAAKESGKVSTWWFSSFFMVGSACHHGRGEGSSCWGAIHKPATLSSLKVYLLSIQPGTDRSSTSTRAASLLFHILVSSVSHHTCKNFVYFIVIFEKSLQVLLTTLHFVHFCFYCSQFLTFFL